MVSTRKSTGSLPPSKRKTLTDSDSDDDNYPEEDERSDEDFDEKPARKRAKRYKRSGDTSKKGSKKDTNANDDVVEELTLLYFDDEKKNPGRMNSLVTGPRSQNVRLASIGHAGKASRKGRVRKRDLGKLAWMTDLPVDVFSEVASYLESIDLLHLSRASRDLRNFLMSKSSRAIWVACQAATGIPPCPSDMCEPQYANLYLEKDCHSCGYPRVERQTEHLRIRLCKGCSSLNVVRGSRLAKENFGRKVANMYEIYSLVPWNSIDKSDLKSLHVSDSKMGRRCFLRYDFVEVVKAYLRTKPDTEERRVFVEKRHQIIKDILQNVMDVEEWRGLQAYKRRTVNVYTSDMRILDIHKRLIDLKYSEMDIKSTSRDKKYCEEWTRLVRQPRALNDRIWAIVRPKLETLIQMKKQDEHDRVVEQNREERKAELLVLYRDYLRGRRAVKEGSVPLCFVDLCEIPMVEELIEEDDCSIKLTNKRWRAIKDNMLQLRDDHSRKVERACVALLLSAKREAGGHTDAEDSHSNSADRAVENACILRRANAFFSKGSSAQNVNTFSEILSARRHNLLNVITHLWGPWDPVEFYVEAITYDAANVLVSSLGFKETVTMEHMDSLEDVFVCQQCDPVLRKSMTWRELVIHLAEEVRDYQRLQSTGRALEIPYLESHRLETDGTVLAIIDECFVGLPKNYAGLYCPLCRREGIYRWLEYRKQIAAHVQTHHGPNVRLEAA